MADLLYIPSPDQRWTPIRVYASYRIVLASLLLLLFFMAPPTTPLVGSYDPKLFFYTSVLYLGLTLLSVLLPQKLYHQRPMMPLLPILVDILIMTLLVHASGGIESSLTVLMLVTIATANIILPGRLGLLSAAVATLAMMLEQFYFSLAKNASNPFHLTESATLGVSFFAVALITRQVAQRLAQSEALAARQNEAIRRLEALNRQVVERMRTGVLVFDSFFMVQLCNRSAQELLVHVENQKQLPETLIQHYQRWLADPSQPLPPLPSRGPQPELDVRFAPLESGDDMLTIMFVEDRARLVQEAQQLKMASLGRMSATIAHEIRNPLSAINHAAELLEEGMDEHPEDRKLLDIIQRHVRRVNGIITDILGLSRREPTQTQRLSLHQALSGCITRWQERGHDPLQLRIDVPEDLPEIRFDARQLEQVLDNLLNNARLHGGDGTIEITAGFHPSGGLPWLRIRDFGPGVPEDARENLFEPFFTTAREGTGLGLFVCRGFCESHQARLDYEPADPGASFVITFAHPDRVFQ